MNPYAFTPTRKIIFYVLFFINKLRVFIDCKTGAIQLFIVEVLWTLRPFTHINPSSSFLITRDYFETWLGKFYVHPDLQSEISLSPAFERQDIDHIFALLKKELKVQKEILFIDIGAHVGIYSIGIGNHFKRYKNRLKILAFEPNANNFYSDNYRILIKNIKANGITNIRTFNKGLGSRKTIKPNKFGITTVPLDSLVKPTYIKRFDTVFIKIDIEGFETDALKGAKQVLNAAKKSILLVEDCVDQKVISYLQSERFKFLNKYTPYNSFWIKE